MKKNILLYALIFLSLGYCYADTLISIKGKSLTTTINNNGLSYYMNLKEGERGFLLTAPPVFSYNNENWYLGEIKPSGLFSFMLDPDSSVFDYLNTKAFSKVSSPSLKPKYKGVAKSFNAGNVAVILPNGLYADTRVGKTYVGILVEYGEKRESGTFMPYWEDEKTSGWNARGIVGFNDSFTKGSFTMKNSAFCIESFKFGLSGTLGWNCELRLDSVGFKIFRRIDSSSAEKPVLHYGYSIDLENICIGYDIAMFQKPVYGGTAQKKTLEFSTSYTGNYLELSMANKTTGEVDFGKSSTTLYSALLKLENSEILANIGINRMKDSSISFNKLNVKINTLNAMFGVSGTKFIMNLDFTDLFTIFRKNAEFKLTINQDRACSISLRLI